MGRRFKLEERGRKAINYLLVFPGMGRFLRMGNYRVETRAPR